MGDSSHTSCSANQDLKIESVRDGKYKALLLTQFPFISTIMETVFEWPKGSILSFTNASDLLKKYKYSPTHVIAISDQIIEISDLASEVLVPFRGYALILFSFNSPSQLMDQFRNRNIFPELKDCIDKGLIYHRPLPCKIDQLTSVAKNIITRIKDDGSPLLLESQKKAIKGLAKRIADQRDADQRHGTGNYMAADRILNGACRSGDYNLFDSLEWQRAGKAYTELITSNTAWNEDKKSQKIKEAMDALESFKNAMLLSIPLKSIWHNDIKNILIVDDQIGMWKPVWAFIFGEDKIDYSIDGEDALRKIGDVSNQYDFVFLDIDLGKGKKGGIEILSEIKKAQYELPVVIMSAYDDSNYTRICFAKGAHYYFAKQLNDVSNRSSIDYYEKIKIIVNELPKYNSNVRKIARAHKNNITIIHYIDRDYGLKINHLLNKAYFFLTLTNDFFLPRKLLLSSRKDNRTEAVINLESALVLLASIIYAKQHSITFINAHKKLSDETKTEIGKTSFLNIQDKLNKCKLHLSEKTMNAFNNARHYKKIAQETAENCFLEFFNIIYDANKILAVHLETAINIINNNPDDEPIPSLVDNGSNTNMTHEDLGNASAEFILQGFKNAGCPKIESKVLFIDNLGENSPWYNVLLKIFNEVTVTTSFIESNPEIIADVVLLDLNLKHDSFNEGCSLGIDNLQAIKNVNFGIPVIILTAENSSYFTKKAMMAGAFAYFCKTITKNANIYWGNFNNIIHDALETSKKEIKIWPKYNNIIKIQGKIVKTCVTPALIRNYTTIIEEQILTPLRSATFHFIMVSRKNHMPEIYNLFKLFIADTPTSDFFISCGASIEGLMALCWEKDKVMHRHSMKMPDAGYLVSHYFDKSIQKEIKDVWQRRNDSKTSDLNVDMEKHIVDTLSINEKVLKQIASATVPELFNIHYNVQKKHLAKQNKYNLKRY